MPRCSVCNSLMVGGYRDGGEYFCSLVCYTANPEGTFCPDCLNETTADAPGLIFTQYTVGPELYFAKDRCPRCHSIVRQKAFCIFLIPVIPLGHYRILYSAHDGYVGRRLRSCSKSNRASVRRLK